MELVTNTTPAQDQFRLPAEFEPHQSGYLIWPQRPDNWRNGGKPAQKQLTQLAQILARYQATTVLVNESQYKNARAMLPNNVRVMEMSSDDAFIKDTGPFYVVNADGEVRCVDFQFNAWGGLTDGLYFPWDKDNEIAGKLADIDSLAVYQNPMILEGCSVIVDGQGTLITTEEVVLSEGRNKNMTKEQAEKIFADYFGAQKVIWLEEGFYLDEAGGDIDNLVNFVRPGELVLSWTDDPNDPQAAISQAAYEQLQQVTDAVGRKFKIHKMQLPTPQVLSVEEEQGVESINGMLPRNMGQRLTATYVNYITVDKAIIFPEFDDPNDELARQQLMNLYPKREVVGIKAREFLTGGGGIHTLVTSVPGNLKES
ncbi:agmatine deiminase [Lentilactobacillus senioris]|uniref:agmatine deiminase n=1 Tax=Lentilactobacillus senioris TaxID=931534 RepID=UPI00228191EF|nr:agmatine deiminase [Lentilactobacillus senioris]MCY9806011.1 agmatine deiminase [Lentilactobacillus senioris]